MADELNPRLALANLIVDARPRVIAALAAQFRDLDLAEDSFAAACETLLCIETWPRDAAAWLFITGKHKGIDILRRNQTEEKVLHAMAGEQSEDLLELPDSIPDERLRLVFICCHPAVAAASRVALTLRIVCGASVADIARAFVMSEAAMYQRITRAKTKIREAGVPFETPERRHWDDRLAAVLTTLEVAYSLAYRDGAGAGENAALGHEVDRLAKILASLLPENPEVLGFAALVMLARSRQLARVDQSGAMVPLSRQDVTLWDSGGIGQACKLLETAARFERSGPYQIMASIHLTHARRRQGEAPDWISICRLYDALLIVRPSASVAINRAVAVGRAVSPDAGLAALNELDHARLADFLPFHVAQADLLEAIGENDRAGRALELALSLGPALAERKFLQNRLAGLTSV